MLHTTKGIVFHTISYSESSVIVKIYTELFGIQSYLVKGIHRAKSKVRPGLFQPLTLLDLVVYHKERQSLQSVKEVHLSVPYQSIPFDIRKSSVALFINELVYKTIREEEANPELFDFLWSACLRLDAETGPVSSFHLLFAMQFCHFLGIFPQMNRSEQCPVFNLREGLFQAAIPDHPQYLGPEMSAAFHALLVRAQDLVPLHDDRSDSFPMDAGSRNQLLEVILAYYRIHLPGFKGVQSHHILHDVLA